MKMSNNINHEIKTIVAELQSMSPRTQLEIVRLCKRVAELTPDYIEDVTEEITDAQYAAFTAALNQAKTELQSQITTNANDIDALEVRTGDAEDDIDSLQTRMSTAEDNIEGNANDIDVLETRMSTAETNIQTNANDIDSLETEMAVIDDKLDTEISVREAIVETTYENTYPVANLKAFNHTLQLKGETGDLLLDGNAIGGRGLYMHNVRFRTTDFVVYCTIITNSNTPFNNIDELKQALINAGFNVFGNFKQCTGIGYISNTNYIPTGLYVSSTRLRLYSVQLGAAINEAYQEITTTIEFVDVVY